MHFDVDVAVIGGGLAGLTAADKLSQAGASVVVAESSSRISGRIHTAEQNGQKIELGAEFINRDHRVMIELCKDLGIPLREDPLRVTFVINGRERTMEEFLSASKEICAQIARDYDRAERDPVFSNHLYRLPAEQYLEQLTCSPEHVWTKEILRETCQAEMGRDLHELPAAIFLSGMGFHKIQSRKDINLPGNGTFRVEDGTERITRALADRIAGTILFNAAISRVRAGTQGFDLETHDGGTTIRATAVVAAAPYSALRHVQFENVPISPEHQAAMQGLTYANVEKAIVMTDGAPFRSGVNYASLASLGVPVWTSNHNPNGPSSFAAYFTGNNAELVRRDPQAMLNAVQNEMRMGSILTTGKTNAVVSDWRSTLGPEGGAYACETLNSSSLFQYVDKSLCKGFIQPAGEDKHPTEYGFMNTAASTAIKAAKRLTKLLKLSKQSGD